MRASPDCRPAVLCYALFVALSAGVGAAALASDGVVTDHTVDQRLPFHSPVLGALALVAFVAVPALVVAWRAWHGDPRVRRAAIVAGAMLTGWIPLEVFVTRELSWRQVVYTCMGALFIAIGEDASLERPTDERGSIPNRILHPNS
jgi:hypothetical protein